MSVNFLRKKNVSLCKGHPSVHVFNIFLGDYILPLYYFV